MRIAICDDNSDFLATALHMVQSWQTQRNVTLGTDTFSDADALIQAHNACPYDIMLLDVVMPLLNGIDAAREIRLTDKTVKIVFLTTSPDFAVESYTVKASNYLLKPLDQGRLFSCLDDITEELLKNSRSIPVKAGNTVHKVELSSIEYVEAQNKRILFSLQDGRSIPSPEPLYAYENVLQLSDGFFKCSRSYIVNIHHIESYTAKEVKMRSGYRIPISRNLTKEFENAYFSVLFGKAGDLA